MWQIFLTAYQEVLSTPDTFFHRLRKAKIKAISLKNCQKILNALAVLEKSQQHGFFYLPFHESWCEARQRINSEPLVNNTLQFLRQLVDIGQAGQANYKYYQQLKTSNFWVLQFQAVRHDAIVYHKMSLLHREWLKEIRYAGYSSQGLLWVYDTVFPVFKNWLEYANQEFVLKQKNMSAVLGWRYQGLLHQLNLELQREKQAIREALYQRLRMGFRFHKLGVEYWTLGFIAQINAIKGNNMDEKSDKTKDEKLKVVPEMTATTFQQATNMIENEGNSEEQEALFRKLSNKDEFVERKDHVGKTYWIPKLLTDRISENPPFYLKLPVFLQFLFWADALFYYFFKAAEAQAIFYKKHNFFPFDQWKIAPQKSIETVFSERGKNDFSVFLRELEAEKVRTQIALSKLSPFFHYFHYKAIKCYERWLYDSAKEVLQRYFKEFGAYLEEHAKRQVTVTDTDQQHLEGILDELKAQNQQWRTPVSLELASLRLQAVNLHINPVTNGDENKNTFKSLYAEFFQIIQAYEAKLTTVSEKTPALLNDLKQYLKQSETAGNAADLYANIKKSRNRLEEISLFDPFFWHSRDLKEQLDGLLDRCDKEITDSSVQQQITQFGELNDAENTLVRRKEVLDRVKNKYPPRDKTKKNTVIKNELEEEVDDESTLMTKPKKH